MSDMSLPRTTTPTALPSTATPTRARSLTSVSAPQQPAEVQRSPSQPQLFKGPQTTADPSSEAQTRIESTPSSTVGQNQHLMQASHDAIMQDAPTITPPATVAPTASATPTPPTPITQEQSMANLRKQFECSEVSFTRSADGTPNVTAKNLLIMSHNPLASTQAKKEGEVFRFFCKSEFSAENTNFFDKAHQLSKMQPGSTQFDRLLTQLVTTHVPSPSPEEVNIPWAQRERICSTFREFQNAQTPQERTAARAKLVDHLSSSVTEISGLMGDTFQRFSLNSADNHKFRNTHILSSAAREFRNASSMDQTKIRGHIKLYNNYQKSLSDPDWQAKETAAKRRHDRVTRNIVQASGAQPGTLKFGLYNTFIRPWKSW